MKKSTSKEIWRVGSKFFKTKAEAAQFRYLEQKDNFYRHDVVRAWERNRNGDYELREKVTPGIFDDSTTCYRIKEVITEKEYFTRKLAGSL